MAVVVATGIALAVFQFLSVRNLWLDEAMLARNILRRSYAGLFQPLDFMQSCPIGLLLVEKVLLHALPNPDCALRLFPLGCYIVGLIVFARLVRRLIPCEGFALIAVSLYAFSNALLYYAGEVKQYGCDVLFTTLLLAQALQPDMPERRRARRLAFLGALAIFFSNAVCLVLPGVWLHWITSRRGAREKGRWLWTGAAWSLAFALYFALFFNDSNRSDMLKWWQECVPSFPFHGQNFAASLRMIVGKTRHLFWLAFGYPPLALFALVATACGLVAVLRRRQWPLVALLALPQVLHVIAASLRQYPLELRLMLYQLPLFLLLIAAPGMTPPTGEPKKRNIVAAAWLVPVAAFILLVKDMPFRRNEIMPCIDHIAATIRPGERILLDLQTWHPFVYYAETGRIPNDVVRMAARDGQDDWYPTLPDCLNGLGSNSFVRSADACSSIRSMTRGRCWVIQGWGIPEGREFSGPLGAVWRWISQRRTGYFASLRYFGAFQRHLVEGHGGRILEEFESYGSKATLYEFPE